MRSINDGPRNFDPCSNDKDEELHYADGRTLSYGNFNEHQPSAGWVFNDTRVRTHMICWSRPHDRYATVATLP
ncbi:hypothetical protein TNCV_4804251 [Trichonephila clavipes]|nr:hypothetical protein TNCV_4804251 [Trichonephila clavipes]